MRTPWIVGLLAPWLLGACANVYYVRPGDLTPVLATVPPDQRVAVFQRAIPALLDQGYVPDVLNETAGYIKARRREDISNDALANTIALVAISPEGHVRIEVSGNGVFGSQEDFVKTISARQALIAKLILGPLAPPDEVQKH
jgi:hypothetical protein